MLALTSSIRTPYHRWRAGVKLALVSAGVFALYLIDSPAGLVGGGGVVLLAYLVAGTAFLREGLRLLRPLWIFVVIVGLWHLLLGEMQTGINVILRLIAAVGLANLVTMTTRLDDLTDLVRWLLSPLERLGLRTAPLGHAISLVVRFTPVLLGKAASLMEAWRARSLRRPGWQIVMPVTLIALDDAEQVAEALRARGGLDGGAGATSSTLPHQQDISHGT